MFCGGGDDVVVVGHEDDMVEEEVVFSNGFIEGLEHDPDDLSLVEAEGSVIGSTDQVVRQLCLDDTQWASHVLGDAKSLPEPVNLPLFPALTPEKSRKNPILPNTPLKCSDTTYSETKCSYYHR